MDEIKLNEEQQNALERIKMGGNFLIYGKSGTGKTTLLRSLATLPNVVFLAPTGNTAQLINGCTIHSFFRLPPLSLIMPENLEKINRKGRKVIRAIETVIIDEISMVRADIFDCIDYRLRQYAPTAEMSQKPFGGRQIVVCGDFFQLPPVVSSQESIDGKGIEEYLEENYGGTVYPFCSLAWRNAAFQIISLKQSIRQAEDADYARLLDDIKLANPLVLPDALQQLNARVQHDYPQDATVLCTTNDLVRSTNDMIYRDLQGEEKIYSAKTWGYYFAEPSDEVHKSFKTGMRVLATANQYPSIHTGDTGTVQGFCDAGVIVKFDSGVTEPVRPFEKARYFYKTEHVEDRPVIVPYKVGTFTQIPLLPAYAITVHRAQGMTIAKAILDLRGGCFAAGQAYVALSRCRSLNDLYLTVPLRKEFFIVDPNVIQADLAWQYNPATLHKALLEIEKNDEDLLFMASADMSPNVVPFLSLLQKTYCDLLETSADCNTEEQLSDMLKFAEQRIYNSIVYLYSGESVAIRYLPQDIRNFMKSVRQ